MFIFDIDGVLADVTHLLPLISQDLPKEKHDYDEYYRRIGEAVPIKAGQALSRAFVMHKVYFVTGRSKRCMADTLAWLKKHFGRGVGRGLSEKQLYMRADDDKRPAHEVKSELICLMMQDTYTTASDIVVFEDDRRCVEMYKQLGCYVNHVKHDKARS